MKVTFQKIADACGVSRNTVSLAMRNSPRISHQTRAKIQAKAKAMGYVRDPELAQIMTQLSNRRKEEGPAREEVACLYTIRKDNIPAHLAYMDAITSYMESHGYHLVKYYFDFTERNARQYNRIFRTRGIRGIIVMPLPPRQDTLQLDFSHLAGVAIGRKLKTPLLHRVDNNYPHATRICMELLVRKGCRRIGAIIPSTWDAQMNHAMRGAYLAWQSLNTEGISIPILDYNRPTHWDLCSKQLMEWIIKHGIDGILCLHFDEAVLLQTYEETGRYLPYALVRKTEDSEGPGVLADIASLSQTAARILISELEHNRLGPPAHPQLTLISGLLQEA